MKSSHFIMCFILGLLLISCDKNPVDSDEDMGLWPHSTPEAQQMNAQILDSAFIMADSTGFIDGLLVIRHGHLVAEEYYNGYDVDEPHNIQSISKSFLSAITGLALHQGYVDSLNEKMLDYFPEYIYPGMDPRKYAVTIEHLLTMRMGIRGEAENNYGIFWGLYNSDNWLGATIEAELVSDPGERMRYNTFQTHLLSAIITKATSQSIWDFATENLFEPMDIDVDAWEQDPQGYYFGGSNMSFTPQEIAMLGYLYLNNGNLNDVQIIPEDWVELTLSPSTNFTHPNAWGAWQNYNYAYLWWLGQINEHDLFMGYGYGGQFLIVFPDLDLIVVSTAEHEVDSDQSTGQEWAIFELVAKYIIPSVND